MAAFLSGVFTSDLHTFIVGEQRTEITVHAESIAQQSIPFDRLLHGPMAEAQDGKTVLEDVTEDTFLRFCQFAYTGDYVTPAFNQLPEPKSCDTSTAALPIIPAWDGGSAPADNVVATGWDATDELDVNMVRAVESESFRRNRRAQEKAKAPSKSALHRQEFSNLNYNISNARLRTNLLCDIRDNRGPEEDHSPVFLGHAQLYVFAEKWQVEALKVLSLHKLHKTLTSFRLYEARRIDIVKLAEYAYSNENTPDRDDNVDELRTLVTHYVTCELENLIKSPEFLALLRQPGHFSQDLMKMALRRME